MDTLIFAKPGVVECHHGTDVHKVAATARVAGVVGKDPSVWFLVDTTRVLRIFRHAKQVAELENVDTAGASYHGSVVALRGRVVFWADCSGSEPSAWHDAELPRGKLENALPSVVPLYRAMVYISVEGQCFAARITSTRAVFWSQRFSAAWEVPSTQASVHVVKGLGATLALAYQTCQDGENCGKPDAHRVLQILSTDAPVVLSVSPQAVYVKDRNGAEMALSLRPNFPSYPLNQFGTYGIAIPHPATVFKPAPTEFVPTLLGLDAIVTESGELICLANPVAAAVLELSTYRPPSARSGGLGLGAARDGAVGRGWGPAARASPQEWVCLARHLVSLVLPVETYVHARRLVPPAERKTLPIFTRFERHLLFLLSPVEGSTPALLAKELSQQKWDPPLEDMIAEGLRVLETASVAIKINNLWYTRASVAAAYYPLDQLIFDCVRGSSLTLDEIGRAMALYPGFETLRMNAAQPSVLLFREKTRPRPESEKEAAPALLAGMEEEIGIEDDLVELMQKPGMTSVLVPGVVIATAMISPLNIQFLKLPADPRFKEFAEFCTADGRSLEAVTGALFCAMHAGRIEFRMVYGPDSGDNPPNAWLQAYAREPTMTYEVVQDMLDNLVNVELCISCRADFSLAF